MNDIKRLTIVSKQPSNHSESSRVKTGDFSNPSLETVEAAHQRYIDHPLVKDAISTPPASNSVLTMTRPSSLAHSQELAMKVLLAAVNMTLPHYELEALKEGSSLPIKRA